MSMLSPSDQDILRMLIKEQGPITVGGTNLEQLVATSQVPQLSGMPGFQDPGVVAKNYPNYRTNPQGNRVGDALITGAELAGTASGRYSQAVNAMYRQAPGAARAAKAVKGAGLALGGRTGLRLAGQLTKLAPGLGAVGGVLGVGDVLFGNDSGANKAMDTAAMTVGGVLGAVGGPMGVAAGAGIGKAVSDGTQWLFGDKKTAEQRKMEEALAALTQRQGLI